MNPSDTSEPFNFTTESSSTSETSTGETSTGETSTGETSTVNYGSLTNSAEPSFTDEFNNNTSEPPTIPITSTTTTTQLTTSSSESTTTCPPGRFPFANTCITANENGGVVITAFILSILSLIGVIGAAAYMLVFRKYFSRKKRHIVVEGEVSKHEMTKLPKTTDNTRSTLPSHSQQQDFQGNPTKRKTRNKPISSHSTTTTTGLHQSQQTNVLNKTPAEKSKQRQLPSDRSNANKQRQPKQQGPPIHTDLDDDFF